MAVAGPDQLTWAQAPPEPKCLHCNFQPCSKSCEPESIDPGSETWCCGFLLQCRPTFSHLTKTSWSFPLLCHLHDLTSVPWLILRLAVLWREMLRFCNLTHIRSESLTSQGLCVYLLSLWQNPICHFITKTPLQIQLAL